MTVHQAYVMGVNDSFTYLTITLKITTYDEFQRKKRIYFGSF